jgi:dimethylargininase
MFSLSVMFLFCFQRMEREATFQYQVLRVPDRDAANCLYINGMLIHRAAEEFPSSAKIFDDLICAKRGLNVSELAKAQAALTCSSILIRKPRHIKSL